MAKKFLKTSQTVRHGARRSKNDIENAPANREDKKKDNIRRKKMQKKQWEREFEEQSRRGKGRGPGGRVPPTERNATRKGPFNKKIGGVVPSGSTWSRTKR